MNHLRTPTHVVIAAMLMWNLTACAASGVRSVEPRIGAEFYFIHLPSPHADYGALARVTAIHYGSIKKYEFVTESESLRPGTHFFVSESILRSQDVAPLLSGSRLREAQSRYEGRDVWSFGRFYITCGLYVPNISNHGPLRIRRIVRAAGLRAKIGLGPAGYLNPRNIELTTASPIVVFFDPPASDLVVNSGVRPGSKEPIKGCINQWMLADERQLDLTYSFEPPERIHPEWSAQILADVESAHIKKGMTHAMVAWALGFPSQKGARAELMRARQWNYPAPPPGDSTVYFSGDRVVRYDPPKRLP